MFSFLDETIAPGVLGITLRTYPIIVVLERSAIHICTNTVVAPPNASSFPGRFPRWLPLLPHNRSLISCFSSHQLVLWSQVGSTLTFWKSLGSKCGLSFIQ